MRVDSLHKCIEFQMDHYLIFIPVYWRLNVFINFEEYSIEQENNNVIERKNHIFSELKNALWHDLFFRCKINPFEVKRDIVQHKKKLGCNEFHLWWTIWKIHGDCFQNKENFHIFRRHSKEKWANTEVQWKKKNSFTYSSAEILFHWSSV